MFVTPAQQPGYAPGLQLSLFASLARASARSPRAKRHSLSWLSRNTQNWRISRARSSAFDGSSWGATPPTRVTSHCVKIREAATAAAAASSCEKRVPEASTAATASRWAHTVREVATAAAASKCGSVSARGRDRHCHVKVRRPPRRAPRSPPLEFSVRPWRRRPSQRTGTTFHKKKNGNGGGDKNGGRNYGGGTPSRASLVPSMRCSFKRRKHTTVAAPSFLLLLARCCCCTTTAAGVVDPNPTSVQRSRASARRSMARWAPAASRGAGRSAVALTRPAVEGVAPPPTVASRVAGGARQRDRGRREQESWRSAPPLPRHGPAR